jgi:hypothetical protein
MHSERMRQLEEDLKKEQAGQQNTQHVRVVALHSFVQ